MRSCLRFIKLKIQCSAVLVIYLNRKQQEKLHRVLKASQSIRN